MQYFHHSSIKNYTIALLDLFNDIHVPRFKNNGDLLSDITVPIKFGNRDKAYMLSEHDLENLHNGNVNILPRMVLQFDGMAKAPDRDTNKLSKINKRKIGMDPADLMYEYHYNAVAYDFNYTILIATRTFTDATIIVEQIAPMFRPDLTLKIQELDIQEKPTSVPVLIEDFTFTLPEDMSEEDIRIIEVEFPVRLKGNLYLPITDAGVIKEIEINMDIIESRRTALTEKYELDFETNVNASKTDITVDDVKMPIDKNDISRAQDDSKTTIEHFKNSGEIFDKDDE
jgi:hypothetical protein